MEKRLIEAVKQRPGLYDKSDFLFRNKDARNRAWLEVAASIGVPDEHCKRRWKLLRDRFVKFKAAGKDKNDWCHMESMQFLTKHITSRKNISNFEYMSDDQQSQQSCSQETIPFQKAVFECFNDTEGIDEQCIKMPKSQRLENDTLDTQLEGLCGTIETVIPAKPEKVPSKNAAFLQMLDEFLQKKPEEVQDRLKIEILTLVYNAN